MFTFLGKKMQPVKGVVEYSVFFFLSFPSIKFRNSKAVYEKFMCYILSVAHAS